MQGSEFDEDAFFEGIARVRALLIGRRALIALGIPVLTSDYDLWVHPDDIEALNHALAPLDLLRATRPSRRAGAADTSSRTMSTSMCWSPALRRRRTARSWR